MKINYFGILKDFDFKVITKESFLILIEKGIFYKRRLSKSYEADEDYFGLELTQNTEEFNTFYLFNRKEYHLRSEVFLEMYLMDKIKIENNNELDYHIKEIEFEIELEKDFYKKLFVLDDYYKKYNSKITDFSTFQFYKNILPYSDEVLDFCDYYANDIDSYEEFSCIEKFLSGIDEFYAIELKALWELMYLVKEISYYCAIKKQELTREMSNQKKDEVDSNITKEIFYNNGLDMFAFLCYNSTGDKNKAFFSYLYTFLNLKSKIVKGRNDNKKYRDYILQEYKLKMSKIIQTIQGKNYTQVEQFKQFDNLLKDYSEKLN